MSLRNNSVSLSSPVSRDRTDTQTTRYNGDSTEYRLLCIDGGGVRGLSALLILRRIMYRIAPNSDNYLLPKPCDYFDIICGTSTGGLIAIMLGRLGMGVQECIDTYCELSAKIFHNPYRIGCFQHVAPVFGKPRFDSARLEDSVKEIVSKRLGTNDGKLFDISDSACKVFVCSVRTANTEPTLLRSYLNESVESTHCTIWEAARATSAAPTFFSSITFGTPPKEYVDGGLRTNNPIEVALQEAHTLWGKDAQFSCILSIGTGQQPRPHLRKSATSILKACSKIATETEATAKNFKESHGELKGVYFRFNVEQGLQGVSLAEWKSADKIDACTQSYLSDMDSRTARCVAALSIPRNVEQSADAANPQYEDVAKARSPYFTNRVDVIAHIERIFRDPNRTATQVAVLTALGGMGKTQVALQYIDKHRRDYFGIFFIDATSRKDIFSAFWRIANLVVVEELRWSPGIKFDDMASSLGFSGLLPDDNLVLAESKYMQIVGAVKRWLKRLKDRLFLMIFDGADHPAEGKITDFLPDGAHVDVIVTSRDSDAIILGMPVEVTEMTVENAVKLLSEAFSSSNSSRTSTSFSGDSEKSEAERIVERLGMLPLAIDQAGCYLGGGQLNILQFLATYDKHAPDILAKKPQNDMGDYRESAWTTWEISYGYLLERYPISAAILGLLAFVFPNDICPQLYNPSEQARGAQRPSSSPPKYVSTETESGFSTVNKHWVLDRDPFVFDEAFAILLRFGLIKRGVEHGTYVFHPVVHVWAQKRLSPQEQYLMARDAMLLVARALPDLRVSGEYRTEAWKIHRRLLPHINAAYKSLTDYPDPKQSLGDPALLRALRILGFSFRAQGFYMQAQELFTRVLAQRRKTLKKHHPDLLESMEDLAAICDHRGILNEAEALYQEALEGRMATLGPEHLQTLATMNELAGVYDFKGDLDQAETLYRKALEGRESKKGPLDPEVLCTVEDLSGLLDHEGRMLEAETLRKRAYDGNLDLFGPESPDTLTSALNLGGFYWQAGDMEKAHSLCKAACEGREKFFGKLHPQTLFATNQMAGLLFNMGHVEESEQLYREVLAGREAALGPEDPDTLWTKNGLGGILLNQAKVEEAEAMLTSAVEGLTRNLGPDHLDTLWVAHDLAVVYEVANKLHKAEELHVRAVNGYKEKLGLQNKDTLWVMTDLAGCYLRENKLSEAHDVIREAFHQKEKLMGFDNPETLYTANCLAGVLWAQGKETEAESLFKDVLEKRRKVQGPTHLDTSWTLQDLGCLYASQGKFSDAETLLQQCLMARQRTLKNGHPDLVSIQETLQSLAMKRNTDNPSTKTDGLTKPRALSHSYGFGCRRRRDERRWT